MIRLEVIVLIDRNISTISHHILKSTGLKGYGNLATSQLFQKCVIYSHYVGYFQIMSALFSFRFLLTWYLYMLSQFRQVFKPIEDAQIFVIYLKAFFR